MSSFDRSKRLSVVRYFLWVEGLVLLFWWPIMHLFFSDLYHGTLGFLPGTYPQPMINVIGSCGLCIVIFSLLAARDPGRNRDIVIGLVMTAFTLAAMYAYQIGMGYFPSREVINLILSTLSGIALLWMYPWKERE
jgi:hypothetical protein